MARERTSKPRFISIEKTDAQEVLEKLKNEAARKGPEAAQVPKNDSPAEVIPAEPATEIAEVANTDELTPDQQEDLETWAVGNPTRPKENWRFIKRDAVPGAVERAISEIATRSAPDTPEVSIPVVEEAKAEAGPETNTETEEKVSSFIFPLSTKWRVPLQFSQEVPLQLCQSAVGEIANRLHDMLYHVSHDRSTSTRKDIRLEEAYQDARRPIEDREDTRSIIQREALDQIFNFLKAQRDSSIEIPVTQDPASESADTGAVIAGADDPETIGTPDTKSLTQAEQKVAAADIERILTENDLPGALTRSFSAQPNIIGMDSGIGATRREEIEGETEEEFQEERRPEIPLTSPLGRDAFVEANARERVFRNTPKTEPIHISDTIKGIQTGHWSKKESLPTENTGGLQVDTQAHMSHAERPRLEKEQEILPSLPFSTEQIDQLRGLGVPEETLNKLLLDETEDAKKPPEEGLAPTTSRTPEQTDNIEHQRNLLRAGGMSPEEIILPEGVRVALASLDKKIEETTGTSKEADWRRIKKGVRAFLDKYVVEKDLPRIQNLLDALERYMGSGSASDLERTLTAGKKEAFRTVAEEENEIREALEEIAKGPTIAEEEDALREALQEVHSAPTEETSPAKEESFSYVSGNGEKNLAADAELAKLQADVEKQRALTEKFKARQEEKISSEPLSWSEERMRGYLKKVGIHQSFEQLRRLGFTPQEIQGLIEHRLTQDEDDAAKKAREAMTGQQRAERDRLEDFYQALGAKPPKEGRSYEYTHAGKEKSAALALSIEEAKAQLRIEKRKLARLQSEQVQKVPPQHRGWLGRLWDTALGRKKESLPDTEVPPLLGTETLIAEQGDTLWSLLEERIPKIPGFENVSKEGRDLATQRYIDHIKTFSLEQVRSLGIRASNLGIWKGDDVTKILDPENLPKPFDFEEVLREIRKRGI